MSEPPQKRRRLLLPNNADQADVSATPSRISMAPESLADPSSSQIVNETPFQRPANPQRPIAMFSDIEHLHVTGGNFTLIDHHDSHNILKHVAFQSLPRSRDAAFSAAINLDNLARRGCTEGTRVDIIAQIMAWVKETDPAKAPPVYWLTGLAGLGKTTIAYTICELLEEAHLPFASFFCSLQLDSRNSKLLVPTLCRDLAELYNSYAASVLPILETNSKAVDARLRIQIDELLAKPWQACIAQRQATDLLAPIIVVDALDESDRGSEFLEELLRVIHANQLAGIKFLVTSRPDPKIVALCKSFPPNAVCKLHEVDTANVQNDIEKYLREALPELQDEPELALLSQRAGGLFIYATTAVRFISPPHSPASVSEMRSHLQAMLNPEPLTSHAEIDERLLVDELYERILGGAFRDARVRAPRLRILHSIVCAESRIDITVLADLVGTDQDTVKRVVESLHAVLFISSKDGCVYWYHASFPDFVFSEARARINLSLQVNGMHRTFEFSVCCNGPAHHGVLALRCFFVMQSLHFNMCNLPSSYIFDSEVPGLSAFIDKTFSRTLRYVSRQWARHLLQAVPAKGETDGLLCGLRDFLDNKLLFWMESMNLIGAKSECSSLLKDAESWLQKGKEWPDLLGQLADATSFSAFFAGSPASNSTPHLYISALSMWNQESSIWRNWRHRLGFIPSLLLPMGAITVPLLTISTPNFVTSITISPDSNRIVSGSRDKSAWVWDVKTGELLRGLQGHTGTVTSVAFSPDGNRVVSGSEDESVRVWGAKTGELLRELQGHTDPVTSVAFSADGTRVVSGSGDESVRVWDTDTGEQLRELQGHTGIVTSVAFSSDGKRVVSGSADESVRVWNVNTGEQLRELQGHTWNVNSVAFSPDGNQIVSGSDDQSVLVWDAKTGERLVELVGHTDFVTSVVFSPDGDQIVSGSADKSVRVWDAKTGEPLRELQGHTDSVTSVAFSPDGNRIVSGSADDSVGVWDTKTGGQLAVTNVHTMDIASVVFSPDGDRFVSGSSDMSVRVWDAKTGEQLMELEGHNDRVTSLAFSPDGNRIASCSYDKSVRIWDAKTGKLIRELQGHTERVTSAAFSPDGNHLVSGSNDASVRVWDVNTGKLLTELQEHTNQVTSVTFSPDGDRIVSCSDKSVWMWDAKTGELLPELQGHTDSVTSVTFSPDGNQIVSGSADESVRMWDAKTGALMREMQGHTDFVTSVAYSLDGNRIVSGSADESLRVWDANTGELLRELQGHTGTVTSVAFSPDSKRIVSGSTDTSLRVWANLNIDAPWSINEDGWILSGTERLVWVPLSIRNVLLCPHNTLLLSQHGYATISFAESKLGTFWHECYTP